jgi:hypothetical protein
MLLQFRHHMTTVESSHASSPKASGSKKPLLPKGWVYVPEEVRTMVKVEVADPDLYQMLDAPLTRSKCKVLDLDEQLHPYPPASNITKAQHSSHSISATSMAVKCRRVISALTSTLQTPL